MNKKGKNDDNQTLNISEDGDSVTPIIPQQQIAENRKMEQFVSCVII